MGLRDRVALTLSIILFSMVHCTFGVPCLFKNKEDLFYELFFPIEKSNEMLSLPLEKISDDKLKEKTNDIIPPETIMEEVQEPIAQQSKPQMSYKDLSSESLLKALNFPEMEYAPSFYPEKLNFEENKKITKNKQKVVNKDFSQYPPPSLTGGIDFPEVEYPTKISDVHKPYWNPQTAPFEHINCDNQIKLAKPIKKNKKMKTKAIKNNKVISKITKIKPEKINKPGEKNTTQIVLSNLSEESLSEKFTNISKITYCNITDCFTVNLSPNCDKPKSDINNNVHLPKSDCQHDVISKIIPESIENLEKNTDIVSVNKSSNCNSLQLRNSSYTKDTGFAQDDCSSILNKNPIIDIPVENEILTSKPLTCKCNMNNKIQETCPKEKGNATNNFVNTNIKTDSFKKDVSIETDSDQEFTTDEPYSDDSSYKYIISTVSPLPDVNKIDSFWDESGVFDFYKSSEFSDELTDYFILI